LAPAVAVVFANRVVACSEAARVEGVECGLRRRQAESRCPGIVMVADDPGRDVRAFEPVVAAVEAFTPGVEIVRPGVCAFVTRGPSRYFGGDASLAAKVARAVDGVLAGMASGAPRCRVGVADGRLAAELAALSSRGEPVVVARGGSRAFLADFSVAAATAGDADRADLLVRLGIRTLGDLAALPLPAVLARFGTEGATSCRRARGLDELPLAARTPPPDLAVTAELDPPVDRLETVAFLARSLAEELHLALATRGLAATRVLVEAETEHGEWLARRWRHDGGLTPAALAERVRWQIEGWLAGRPGPAPPADDGRPDVGASRSPGDRHAPKTGDTGPGRTDIGASGARTDPSAPKTGAVGPIGANGAPGDPSATKTGVTRPGRRTDIGASGAPGDPSAPKTGVTAPGRHPDIGANGAPGDPHAPKTGVTGPGRTDIGASGARGDTSAPKAGADRPTGGLVLLRLTPDEVGPDDGRQLGFWGGDRAAAERVARALARVQGVLGPESVMTAILTGGRGPYEQARLLPWGDALPDASGTYPFAEGAAAAPPWPGRIPPPAPATVHPVPRPAEVFDAAGGAVTVTGRATVSAPPARLAVAGQPPADVVAWAGPWPVDERWWDPAAHRRRARSQVVTADGAAYLLVVERGRWAVEAAYD
jgi:protein ImuB